MEPSSREPIIEFIDVEPSNPDDVEQLATSSRNGPALLAATTAVMCALVLVGLTITNRPGSPELIHETPPATSISTTTIPPSTTQLPPETEQLLEPLEPVGFVPWPQPAKDHDPHVTIVPGAGVPIFGTETQTTLVYVNSLGRPTVVNLDTGNVSNVIVAPTRSRDSFVVEIGTVVSLDDSSRNIPKATTRAIAFYTFRDELATTSDSQLAATAPGPLLCLSELPCQVTGWQSVAITRGADEFRHVTPEDDPEVYEALFGDSWKVDGFFRHAPDGRTGNLRLPVPMSDVAWIVHQPVAGPTPADR